MTYRCPDCDYESDSERGVKIHHGKKHDGSLSRETRVCKFCDDEFVVTQALLNKGRGVFCSNGCCNEWQRESVDVTGENSPRWAGGHNAYRGANWFKQREKALERAGYVCEKPKCDKSENLHVHHIVPFNLGTENGYFDEAEEANELSNLIAFCASHHHSIEPAVKYKQPIQ